MSENLVFLLRNGDQLFDDLAGETAISGAIDERIVIRGYPLADFIAYGSYETLAFLLLHGRLPEVSERSEFTRRVLAGARLSSSTHEVLGRLPDSAAVMDRLSIGLLTEAAFDSGSEAGSELATCEQLLGRLAGLFIDSPGNSTSTPSEANSLAALLVANGDSASLSVRRRIVDRVLMAYAENEWNSSTFAARLIASTRSDLTSAIVGAIGALKGSLHGGANERAFELLCEIETPNAAESFVERELAQKRRFMGFGHRRFRAGDPRAEILRPYCEQAARETGHEPVEAIAAALERAITAATGLRPNIDWPCARLMFYAGIEPRRFTPFFAVARSAGWCAHVLEERLRGRLMSPHARYVGPAERAYPESSIAERE